MQVLQHFLLPNLNGQLISYPVSVILLDARVCLFSIPHHLRHPYLNNTTPSSTPCVENIQLGSSEKISGFFFPFLFLISRLNKCERQTWRRKKKTPHILSSCLERFINELDVPAHNLFFFCPPFHVTYSARRRGSDSS